MVTLAREVGKEKNILARLFPLQRIYKMKAFLVFLLFRSQLCGNGETEVSGTWY